MGFCDAKLMVQCCFMVPLNSRVGLWREMGKRQSPNSVIPLPHFGVKVFLCSFLGNKMLQQNIVVSDILQRWCRRAAGCIISQCLLAVSSCQWPYFDFGFRYKKLLWWLFILNSFCLFSRWWHSECLGGSDILQTQTEHVGNLQLSLPLLHNFSAFLAFPSLKNCSSSVTVLNSAIVSGLRGDIRSPFFFASNANWYHRFCKASCMAMPVGMMLHCNYLLSFVALWFCKQLEVFWIQASHRGRIPL